MAHDVSANKFPCIIPNVILSGDNAVVIAMAVRSLPRAQRQKGIEIHARTPDGTSVAPILRGFSSFIVTLSAMNVAKNADGVENLVPVQRYTQLGILFFG